jgi:hypothetical protein
MDSQKIIKQRAGWDWDWEMTKVERTIEHLPEFRHTMLHKYDCMNHQMQKGVLQIILCAMLQHWLIECYGFASK